jgi:hypothetical protein
LNELIDYFRHLIIPYNRETVFIQLFEYICTMHGASSITLDRLKQQMQSIDEHSKQIYNAVIDKIEKLSRSIKALIELNKMKISQFDQESIITHSFSRFHRNFNVRVLGYAYSHSYRNENSRQMFRFLITICFL